MVLLVEVEVKKTRVEGGGCYFPSSWWKKKHEFPCSLFVTIRWDFLERGFLFSFFLFNLWAGFTSQEEHLLRNQITVVAQKYTLSFFVLSIFIFHFNVANQTNPRELLPLPISKVRLFIPKFLMPSHAL